MKYTPEPAGQIASLDDARRYMLNELRRISIAFSSIDNLELPTLHAAPARPREGMVVLADGTDWNPGSGAGFYGYRAGAWVLLG